MEKIFLRETGKPQKAGGYFRNRMRVMLSLCVILAVSLLPAQSVFATENNTQRVKVILVDAVCGDRLEGAQFTLAEKVNDSYQNMTGKTEISVSEAGYDFGELNVGEYQLTEIKAPSGYIIGSIPIEFEVTADGVVITNEANAEITAAGDGIYEITVSNAIFMIQLPSTGGIGTLPYTVSGILLMIAALVYSLVLRCRRSLSN